MNETRKTTSFIIPSKKLSISDKPSEIKDLCNENYKKLKKEIEEELEQGKNSHYHGLI
jgi:uncharacterized Fe-S cluster-containing protein